MMPSIFFITGPSGAGKSTLARMLKRNGSLGVVVHDLDEFPFPKGISIPVYRRKATHHWMKCALRYAREGKATVICGLTYAQEIKCSRYYSPSLQVHYGCLCLSDGELLSRLQRRRWKKSWLKENLAIKRFLVKEIRLQKNHYFVSSGSNSPKRVAFLVTRWIQKSLK